MTAIRSSAIAGSFYPADPAALQHQVEGFLSAARAPASAEVPKAIIAPHAGYIYSGPIAASAYARLAPARGRIDRVVLIGPSHRVPFRGIAVDTGAEAWRTPLGDVPLDRKMIGRLMERGLASTLEQAYEGEHALEVHLPFLQAALGTFQLVPLVAGDAAPEAVAALLEEAWGGPETLIVISTDLSHYLDYGACQASDLKAAEAIERLDIAGLGSDDACGRVPVRGMLLAASRRGMSIARLDLRNSGDTAGPRDRVVGYGSWALFEPQSAKIEVDETEAAIRTIGPKLLAMASASILHGLTEGKPAPVAGDLPEILTAPGAAFVTIKKRGDLRGCIGSPQAWRSLAKDVTDHAFNAAFRDPRFPPLGKEEVEGLTLSVSVLTPPEPMSIASEADLLAQLRPGVDGLIIEDAGRRALFLPAVWESIPEAHAFLRELKRKAGMPDNHWSAAFTASRFRAIEVKGEMTPRPPAPPRPTWQWQGASGSVTLRPT